MRYTPHSRHRMARCGIPQRLLRFVLYHGRADGVRHVLDKGGISIVDDDGAVITTRNFEQLVERPRSGSGCK